MHHRQVLPVVFDAHAVSGAAILVDELKVGVEGVATILEGGAEDVAESILELLVQLLLVAFGKEASSEISSDVNF